MPRAHCIGGVMGICNMGAMTPVMVEHVKREAAARGIDVDMLKWCCMAAAEYGMEACTCWEQVYTDAQAPPQVEPENAVPAVRTLMCDDCAYRPDSPEKAAGEQDTLDSHAVSGRFFCHQGMRRVTALRHPIGIEIPASLFDRDDYAPVVLPRPFSQWGQPAEVRIPQVSYKADGTPADLCAGWAARRKALLG